jgi:geranylgeranyl pyrophosphate synthase
VNIADIRRPVAADMDVLVKNLLCVVGDRHPMLMAAAQQIFGAGGKKLRPMLVFLVARATCKSMHARCVCPAFLAPGIFAEGLNNPKAADSGCYL